MTLSNRAAASGTLVTGVVRDRSGAAVVGARVRAVTSGGRDVGDDLTLADGTFALELTGAAARFEVTCAYCRKLSGPFPAAGEPVVAIVERYNAVAQASPQADDIRALPYRRADEVAALRPFAVLENGRLSDRGLDAYGVTLVDGLPLYSAADGDNYARLIPAHALAALTVTPPAFAPEYGGYAHAGTFDLRLRDPDTATSRFDDGNAFDLVARAQTPAVAAVYGRAGGDGDRRSGAFVDADVPVAGGTLHLAALDVSDATADASGIGAAYQTDSRRYTTSTALQVTRSQGSSLVTVGARVRNRGPLALEFGVRAMRATVDTGGSGAAQADGAVYVGATRTTATSTVLVRAAIDRGSDGGLAGHAAAAAFVGSVADDVRLGAGWTAHAAIVTNLRIPTFTETALAGLGASAVDRSLLFEQSLTYSDLHRLRLTGAAYTQRTTGAATFRVNGIGLDAAWQIAPQFTLRTWLLRADMSSLSTFAPPASGYPGYTLLAAPLTGRLFWLTYEHGIRVDALVRGGALEGDVRIPLDRHFAFALGTARSNAIRTTTAGITLR